MQQALSTQSAFLLFLQVLWKWMTFNPPGRPDLKLEHWTKVLKDAVTGRLKVDEEEYPFKKFNKKVWLSSF